jgi:DNA-binding IclR family transcriptional regulator
MTKELMGKKLPNLFFAPDGRGGATAIQVIDVRLEVGSNRQVVTTGTGKTRYAFAHEKPLRATIREALALNHVQS